MTGEIKVGDVVDVRGMVDMVFPEFTFIEFPTPNGPERFCVLISACRKVEPEPALKCNCGADGWNRSGTAPEHRQVPHALNCAVQTAPSKLEPVCWRCGHRRTGHDQYHYARTFNSERCNYAPERRITTSDRRKGPGDDARKLALDELEKWKDGGWNARIQLRTALRAEDNVFGRCRIRRACDRKEKA